MIKKKSRNEVRRKRSFRTKKTIRGTAERPRMTVYKGRNLYVQIIDDVNMKTLVSSSSISKDLRDKKLTSNINSAEIIGSDVAEKAIAKGIKSVVFDRNGNAYTGVIAALADAARKKGLNF